LKKTPYELYKGRKPNISHLRVFGCKCLVLNNGKESLGKFDAKANETIFLGYSLQSKAYKVFNRRTLCVEESLHVVCDETNLIVQEILWKMKMQVFMIRILHLKMKPKLKSLNKAKKSLSHLLKTSQENEELKETSP